MTSANYVLIPDQLFDDGAFSALPAATRIYLIELYREYGDCERFSLSGGSPKLRNLIKSGLIAILGKVVIERQRQTLFLFKHSSAAAYE
jgi:hypothetical protein